MQNIMRKATENLRLKFIVCLLFCMAVLLGVCPETDTHVLRPAQGGVNVICAAASDRDAEVATRETLGQYGTLREQYRLRGDARKTDRGLQVFYLFISAILPGVFLCVCRILSECGEWKNSSRAFIIRFIHDLDGSKTVVA